MPIEISGPPLPPPDSLPVRPDALEVYDALPVEPEVWVIPLRRPTEAEYTVTRWDDAPLAIGEPYRRGHLEGDYRLIAHAPPE